MNKTPAQSSTAPTGPQSSASPVPPVATPAPAACHTAGPWQLQESRDGGQTRSILHRDTQAEHGQRVPVEGILWTVASVNLCMGEESEANARLIAAAPALLEALQRVSYHMDRNLPAGVCRDVLAAIAAATGGEGVRE